MQVLQEQVLQERRTPLEIFYQPYFVTCPDSR